MFIVGNFLDALATVLSIILTFYMWLIIIRVFVSWLNPDPYNPIVSFLYRSTDPVLYSVRSRFPFLVTYGLDFTPFLVILIIIFFKHFLVKSLFDLASHLRG